MDNHLGISAYHLTHGSRSTDVVRPKESQPEEADISGKGTHDQIGLRLSIRLGVSKLRGANNRKASPHATELVATCPFVGVRGEAHGCAFQRRKDARSRHQRLFVENVGKTEGNRSKRKF